MDTAGRRAKGLLRRAGALVWPSRSIVSGEVDGSEGAVPPDDFARLVFIDAPLCRRCGLPLEVDLGPDGVCGACRARPPRWGRARAALVYDDVSRKAVLDLKRTGRRDGLATLARWMQRAGRELLAEADLIVPVPLHYRRLVSRGFNQAGWLAAAVARESGVPVHPAALKRIKATASQGGLSARARRANVAGAFTLRQAARRQVNGRRVLLVDDVLTTGATLEGCVRALKAGGAAQVDVLTLARVVRARDVTI